MRSWIRRQRKNKSRLRAWMSWSLVVIVIVGGLFAISSTHLANIQNAISGITQPPVGQAVSSGSTPRSDTLAPIAFTQYVNPFVGSDWARPSFGYAAAAARPSPARRCPFGMAQWSPDSGPTPSWALDPGGYSYSDHASSVSASPTSTARAQRFWRYPVYADDRGAGLRATASGERYSATFTHGHETAEPAITASNWARGFMSS